MKKEYLPIGTVVLLAGGTKKVMITGYSTKAGGEIYDYNGCIFPEGFMENQFCLFNKSQIEEIFYMGLENEESNDYVEKVTSMLYDRSNASGYQSTNSTGSVEHKRTRQPKEPTNPLSSGEMKARYTREKISGNQTKTFDFDKIGRE